MVPAGVALNDDERRFRNGRAAVKSPRDLLTWPLLGLVRCYSLAISPLLGANCRFQPSCAAYAEEALKVHGSAKGGWLVLKRIARCHPWGGSGFDPVPGSGAESGPRSEPGTDRRCEPDETR